MVKVFSKITQSPAIFRLNRKKSLIDSYRDINYEGGVISCVCVR